MLLRCALQISHSGCVIYCFHVFSKELLLFIMVEFASMGWFLFACFILYTMELF